jgi:hypothetical protein
MLAILEAFALMSGIAVCVGILLLVLQVRHALQDANQQLQSMTKKTSLLLDDAHHLTLEAGLTAMEARKASADERKALPQLTAQTEATLRSANALLDEARMTTRGIGTSQQQIAQSAVGVLTTTDATVRGLQPVMEQARASLVQLQTVEADLDARVNDPAIAQSLQHIDATTASLEASAKDVQQEVHAMTHPTWVRRVWHGALDVAHVFNPL